jgi:hypothetical protein
VAISQNHEISSALAAGDSHTLSTFFNESVEMTLSENVGVYDVRAANKALAQFFLRYNPKSYKSVHAGSSKGNSSYSIGLLETDNGVFRVYLYYKKVEDNWTIQEIRFEKES